MKKLLPILLVTSLLLSACGINQTSTRVDTGNKITAQVGDITPYPESNSINEEAPPIIQPQEQTAETKAVTKTETKETKIRKCEVQAWEYFQDSSPETVNENGKLNERSVMEHYNSKLDKCFAKILQFRSTPKNGIASEPIIISSSGRIYPKNPEYLSTMWMSIIVSDISDGKIYGEYTEKITKEGEPKIIQCKIGKECSSQDDFEIYILPYMKD